MLVEPVVHVPEAVLRSRRLRGLGGDERVLVGLDEWEVAKDECDLLAELSTEGPQDRVGLAAERALEVTELDEQHGSAQTAPNVVVRTNV